MPYPRDKTWSGTGHSTLLDVQNSGSFMITSLAVQNLNYITAPLELDTGDLENDLADYCVYLNHRQLPERRRPSIGQEANHSLLTTIYTSSIRVD